MFFAYLVAKWVLSVWGLHYARKVTRQSVLAALKNTRFRSVGVYSFGFLVESLKETDRATSPCSIISLGVVEK